MCLDYDSLRYLQIQPLTALTLAGLVIGIIISIASPRYVGSGGLSFTDVLALLMVAVFWFPNANAWFTADRGSSAAHPGDMTGGQDTAPGPRH